MTGTSAITANRERIAILWICLGLFLVRVVGQVEVWLIAPTWLPPMEFWYSGLVAYPVLLPAQILLLMTMTVIVIDGTRGIPFATARVRRAVRSGAVLYFGVMLLRLIVQFFSGASNALEAGGIPIAFHWVLALFLYELSRSQTNHRSPGDAAVLRIPTRFIADE
jgi:hypothetical protein